MQHLDRLTEGRNALTPVVELLKLDVRELRKAGDDMRCLVAHEAFAAIARPLVQVAQI
jgi:hypothetical protein